MGHCGVRARRRKSPGRITTFLFRRPCFASGAANTEGQLNQTRAKVVTAECDFSDAELLNREAARLGRSAVISKEEAQRKQIAQDGARSRLQEAKAVQNSIAPNA